VSALDKVAAPGIELDTLGLDERTASILEPRGIDGTAQRNVSARHRGWLVRRALLAADVTSLILAYVLAKLIVSGTTGTRPGLEFAVLVLMLPVWVVAAKLHGLYERDEEQVDHSTVDEVVGVFHLVTLGAWLYIVGAWAVGVGDLHVHRLVIFWLLAAVLVVAGRGIARAAARRSPLYLQNTIIIGAGHIGQLAARKLLQHPEYGVNLVGFVDAHPRPRRPELEHLAVVGPPERLGEIVELFDVERVIIAFSDADHEQLLKMIRKLRQSDLQIDVVPRLFEIVGPKAGIHAFEGLSVVALSLKPKGLEARAAPEARAGTEAPAAWQAAAGLQARAARRAEAGPEAINRSAPFS